MADDSDPPYVGVLFVYCTSFVTTWTLYKLLEALLPLSIQHVGFDFLKSLTICVYPFGHVILWKYYDSTGYLFGMVPLMLLTLTSLPKGDATPVALWSKYFHGVIPLWSCVMKTCVQLSAGLVAYKFGLFLYQTELNEHFTSKLKDEQAGVCNSSLKVPFYQGFFIETLGLVYDAWFSTLNLSGNKVIDTFLKLVNRGLVVVTGVQYTGMIMNPAKASALTYGCGQTPVYAHLIVYWLGPLLGAWLISNFIQSQPITTKSKQEVSEEKKNK